MAHRTLRTDRPRPHRGQRRATKAYQRTIVFGDRPCVRVVEAQGTDSLPPEADRQRFLTSFQSTGAVTW